VIGLVQIGPQAIADRYTYLPLIGLFLMVAWGLPDLWTRWRWPQWWLAPAAGAVVATLTIATWHQVGYWQSSITLFEHTLRVTERNAVAHATLGSARMNEGNDEQAIAHLNAALAIEPALFTAHQNLAAIFARRGDGAADSPSSGRPSGRIGRSKDAAGAAFAR
jgi:tetratricopeptide (TPR) repeat protein